MWFPIVRVGVWQLFRETFKKTLSANQKMHAAWRVCAGIWGSDGDVPTMSDDAEQPESGAGEPKPPKIKAEDNPWYLLATLYGEPESGNVELRNKNRIAWNRYFAAILDEETRARLIHENRHPEEELKPFSPGELEEVKRAFAGRCKASGKELALPAARRQHRFFKCGI
jgi:hypothetical protein